MKNPDKNTRLPAEALAPPPQFVKPQLPTAEKAPPRGNGWLHEIKYDGYRLQARIEDGTVRLLTRSGLDWTDKFRAVGEEIGGLRVRNAVIDGEICVFDEKGVASFTALQDAIGAGKSSVMHYVAFDLLYRDGQDMRRKPLRERKEILRELIPADAVRIRYSDHMKSDEMLKTDDILAAACALGAEGIVSKHANSSYRSGRNNRWVKAKCLTEQEMVVGGYTGGGTLGSLLVGYYQDKKLHFAGQVGTGFTDQVRTVLFDGLKIIGQATPPFAAVPDKYRNAYWVEPRLVVNVTFLGWTANGLLRHPVYRYLRDDKQPAEVTRETVTTLRGKKRGTVLAK